MLVGGWLGGLFVSISATIRNLAVVASEIEAALRDRNLPPLGMQPIIGFVLLAFVLGIATIWLYAAIRPRFGAGAGTAVIAGVAVWFFAYVYSGVGMTLMSFLPARLMTLTLA